MMQATEQRERALRRANEIRIARKELKARIKAGEVDVADLIEDPLEFVLSASIGEVVMWTPGVGPWRQRQILSGLVSPNKKLEALGARTRSFIAMRLRDQPSGVTGQPQSRVAA